MHVPVSSIDFYSDEVIQDPYPVYAQLRELGPVVYLEKNDLYVVARYKEVSEVLLQPLRFVSSKGVSPIAKVNDILVGSTLNSDPPRHDKTRAVTSAPLLPGALVDIEPRLKASADQLIETLCARGEFDAISDLAQYLPVTIVAELVGLPQAVGPDQMLKWASAAFNLFSTENDRTTQAFEDLKTLRDFLLEYGRPEMLAEGGWAKRIFTVGPEHGFTFETCTQLMRDYINPSLDTTISATGQIIKFFADNPSQWDLIRSDESLIPNAIEEAVRLATPIRAFTRYAIEDTEVSGQRIPAGKRVIVCYASANRDERKFVNPDAFDVTRDVHDHVGFGQGVHMCMGMHLARKEMSFLLKALRRRVTRFELTGEPTVAMNNSIRAFATLPVRVHAANEVLADTSLAEASKCAWLNCQIATMTPAATDISSIELVAENNETLPSYDAGAHVDVYIKPGLVRQYSLTGDPADRSRYRLGVLHDPQSRGGSLAIHDEFTQGQSIQISYPRNHFHLKDAAHTILFAGGIGVTPMLSMAYTLESAGASWEMHYCGRSHDRLAFVEEMARFGDKVKIYVDDGPKDQALKIDGVLQGASTERQLYVCGPNGFMDFVVDAAAAHQWNQAHVHLERFGAEIDTDGAAFTVIAQKSGKEFEVQPGETIHEKLTALNIDVNVSCQSGVCGTCLTRVVDGKPDHRDLVQTDAEKASNEQITICCSRSKTKTLVLDL